MSSSALPSPPLHGSTQPPNPFALALDDWNVETGPEEYPTAGALARRLDRLTVQTPALRVVDSELGQVADAVRSMLRRREVFANLVGSEDDAEAEEIQEAIVAAEEAVPAEGNDRLILSMPPQEGKTERVGRRGVTWFLKQFPELRIGIVSYDGDHAARISGMSREDIELFNGEDGTINLGLKLARNQRAVSRWNLIEGGGVYAIGIGGGLTGRPLDLLLIDDPVKDIRNADSILLSGQAWNWWQTVARPRLAPWAPVILVQTRWHEADLAGRMISKQVEDEGAGLEHYDRWKVVNIPAQADHHPEKGEVDVLGRKPGEFMVSARGRTEAQWEATKNATSARFWSALYQGRPTPDVGEIWLRAWWRRYSEPLWSAQPDGTYQIPDVDRVVQSWDMSFKDKKSSDYVVGQVWAKRGASSYLVYQIHRRLSFTATLDAMRRVSFLFPQAHKKIVEDKANGTAVIDSLKKELPGIVESEPTTSKVARADAVSPFIRAGNVLLPTVAVASMERELAWDVEGFIAEATSFPNIKHDDQVDSTSQYLAETYLGPGGKAEMSLPTGRTPDRINPAARGLMASPVHRDLLRRQLGSRK